MDIIVGTAGHIDHGKTALVRALTGTDTDRLPDEKKRGITIDLGFAEMEHGGMHFGFVDVPGHERFIKNMLAGASGIDLVLLVVAADEGVMPQTREHFEICRLLNIGSGIVVLTKCDLVEGDMLELVKLDVAELVEGSFLENAPVAAVDSVSGRGIEELKTDLAAVSKIAQRAYKGMRVPILPIDRVFSKKGFGTVVTGTLVSGAISEGDELDLLPSGKRVRVRGLQTHGTVVKSVDAGQRTAVNIAGIDQTEVARGMILAETGVLRRTQSIDAAIEVLADSKRPLRSRQRVRLHLGSAEILARVAVLNESKQIEPGEQDLAQLRLESPTAAVLGERFVIRSYSPQMTIAGGQVLDPHALRHRGRDRARARSFLAGLSNDIAKPAFVLKRLVEFAEGSGIKVAQIRRVTGWERTAVIDAIAAGTAEGSIVELGDVLMGRGFLDLTKERLLAELSGSHERDPLSPGVKREALKHSVLPNAEDEIFEAALTEMESAGSVAVFGELVGLSGRRMELTAEESDVLESLLSVYRDAGPDVPKLSDVLAIETTLARDRVRRVFQLLVDSGAVVKVTEEFYFAAGLLDQLKLRLREYAAGSSDRSIGVPQFKELAGVSRKYAIPLLEYFDREKVTVRSGDKRLIL